MISFKVQSRSYHTLPTETTINYGSFLVKLTRVGLVLIRFDSYWLVLDSCWLGLTRVGLVLIRAESSWTRVIRVDFGQTRVDLCWLVLSSCWFVSDSCWFVLTHVDLCWHSCIRIGLISLKKVSLGCYRFYNFPYFSYILLLKISFISFFYFISTEKWNKKGKYLNGVQIFTFSLEHRFVWRQIFQKKFQMVIWSENVFNSFMTEAVII